jgi:hypothetical protein
MLHPWQYFRRSEGRDKREAVEMLLTFKRLCIEIISYNYNNTTVIIYYY